MSHIWQASLNADGWIAQRKRLIEEHLQAQAQAQAQEIEQTQTAVQTQPPAQPPAPQAPLPRPAVNQPIMSVQHVLLGVGALLLAVSAVVCAVVLAAVGHVSRLRSGALAAAGLLSSVPILAGLHAVVTTWRWDVLPLAAGLLGSAVMVNEFVAALARWSPNLGLPRSTMPNGVVICLVAA